MIAFIKNRSDRAWLILLLATATTFSISDARTIGIYAGIATLLIAYIKGRLIVLDFMELRHAPPLWRGLFEAWLLLVLAALLAVYLAGQTAPSPITPTDPDNLCTPSPPCRATPG